MEENQVDCPPPARPASATRDLVVLDRSLFRIALITAAVFLLLLTGGTLWTLFAVQDRQTVVLREEFAHLAAALKQNTTELPIDADMDPRSRVALLQEQLAAAQADLHAEEERLAQADEEAAANAANMASMAGADQPDGQMPDGDDNALSLPAQDDAASTALAETPVGAGNETVDDALPEDPALAASRELNTRPLIPATSLTQTSATQQNAAQATEAERGARIATLATPAATTPKEAAAETPLPAEEQTSVAAQPQGSAGAGAQAIVTTETNLPVRKFAAKPRIKKNPRAKANSSGGLFITSADERNQQKLQQESNDYLSKSNNLPLGLPVQGKLGSSFGTRSDPFNRKRAFHSGIDFQAKTGTPIRSTADGMIVYSGFTRDYGHHIIISHGREYETLYAHMSRRLVEKGRLVVKGQKIGLVGSTGRSTGPHLHYEIRQYGKVIDPREYVAGGRIKQTESRTVAQEGKKKSKLVKAETKEKSSKKSVKTSKTTKSSNKR